VEGGRTCQTLVTWVRAGVRPPDSLQFQINFWSIRGVLVPGKKPQVPPLRSPGFPVEDRGVDGFRAALSKESRIRCRCWHCEVGNPGTLRDDKGERGRFQREKLHRSRFSSPWVGLRPMIPPVGMTILSGSSISRISSCGHKRIVIPTGAQRSGGTCGLRSKYEAWSGKTTEFPTPRPSAGNG
jgi:hypothetical protein